jgi:DNA-binding XRE family transcriptional regulator/quercetin dioxygenase-like cupin family protein
MMGLDAQTAALGLGVDAVERAPRDVSRSHAPTLLGQPERVAALAGADVECAARGEAADLFDERAVRVTGPHAFAPVTVIPVRLVGRWSGSGFDVVVGETEADHGADPAAVGGGLQHLLARISHVAGRIDARYCRCAGCVGLHEVPEPGWVSGWSEAERHERLSAHPEPWADNDRVGADALVVGQLDRRDVAVGIGDDAAHVPVHDVHATGSQRVELRLVDVDGTVEDNGVSSAQLAEQPGRVNAHRVGDNLDEPSVADLEAVAERTVDDVTPPMFGEAIDVRELVHQAGGGQNPTSDDGMTAEELDTEPVVIRAGHTIRASSEDLTAVAADLLTTSGDQLRWRTSFTTEVAVHVCGWRVARLAGVDDDHGPALAPELECSGKSGGRSTDDCDVAVPLDSTGGVVTHALDDMVHPGKRGRTCNIRKEGAAMAELNEIEQVARTRLRSLRNTLGLSLDELAARTNLSPSTISRIETGKRTISLDILLPLATALQVDLDALLDVHSDDDVVIRPTPKGMGGRTTWMLSRPTGSTIAVKMRLEPTRRTPEQRVHPGHDWFFVIEGRVRLSLGEREITVETGEAAEFATMTPHAFAAIDGPAELIMIFDRDGQRAHVHREADGDPTTNSRRPRRSRRNQRDTTAPS